MDHLHGGNITRVQVLAIAMLTCESEEVELGFLIDRQSCDSVRSHLDALFDCQPGKLAYLHISWTLTKRKLKRWLILSCQNSAMSVFDY